MHSNNTSMNTPTKKIVLQTVLFSLGLSFLLPMYSYAEGPITLLGGQVSVESVSKEILKDKESKEATNIKEIATTKEAIKEDSSSTDKELVEVTTSVKSFTVCSQEAIELRDTKIASSRTFYNTAMTNALSERKNREKAAVAITNTDDKKTALKLSIDTYKNQAKVAQTTVTQARKTIWRSFEDDIKSCHDREDEENKQSASTRSSLSPSAIKDMKIVGDVSMKRTEEGEVKTIKETIRAGFESLRSLFN